MTETKQVGHTPGPWKVGDNGNESRPESIDACCHGGILAVTVAVVPRRERIANARLIAAAPELLEALQMVEARLTRAARAFYATGKKSALQDALSGWVDDIEPARAAIAKATGGEA